MILRTAFATLALALPLASHACDPELFNIISQRATLDQGYMRITGTVRNLNTMACGVQLQAVFYDAKKQQTGTDEGWIASIQNIAPGATYSFTMMAAPWQVNGGKSYTLKPIAAKQWTQR